jgi:hypothetical protein
MYLSGQSIDALKRWGRWAVISTVQTYVDTADDARDHPGLGVAAIIANAAGRKAAEEAAGARRGRLRDREEDG